MGKNSVQINGSLECPNPVNFTYDDSLSLPACDEMLIYCICSQPRCLANYLELLRRPFFIKLTEPKPEPCPSQTVAVCSTTTCQPEPSPTTSPTNTELELPSITTSSINPKLSTTTSNNTTPPTPYPSCPTTPGCSGPTTTVSNCPTPTSSPRNICKMPDLFHNVTEPCRAVLEVCCRNSTSSHPTTTMITTLVTTAMVVWWVNT